MARKKISEFRAKTILYKALDIPYSGVEIGPEENFEKVIKSLDNNKLYVVKVDQGVKKRGKQGLVGVKLKIEDVRLKIKEFQEKGYQYFLIEEFVAHDQSEEKYFAISRKREGLELLFSEKGGIEIEENAESIEKFIYSSSTEMEKLPEILGSSRLVSLARTGILEKLVEAFEHNYFSFLELNPFLVYPLPEGEGKGRIVLLDAAVEVDSSAEFFSGGTWSSADFRDFSKQEKSLEEKAIDILKEKSQASFSLTMLNPNGSLFMLLSGGGASIVLADEAYNQGFGKEVANYGEYSGNPNAEETYIYTKNLLGLLLRSQAPQKVLIIGGGVANFTDVRITFKGVIQAIAEVADELRKQNVKIFVRRGGPRQKEGLQMMKEFLEKEKLFGAVHGPELVLTQIMKEGLMEIQ